MHKLPPLLIPEAYARYATSRGDLPHQDIEPSDEQLSAIHQVVTAGDPPYVDYSIFGPHGRRMMKRLTFVSQTLDFASGEWKRQELLGPPDFNAWWRCWRVFRTALLRLEISPPDHWTSTESTSGHPPKPSGNTAGPSSTWPMSECGQRNSTARFGVTHSTMMSPHNLFGSLLGRPSTEALFIWHVSALLAA